MNKSGMLILRQRLQGAYDEYQETGDQAKYFGQVAFSALNGTALAIAQHNPRYEHLPMAVAGAQYPIRALAQMLAEKLDCPFETVHDDASFARHFWSHVKDYANHDLETVRKNAKQVNDVMSHLFGH